MNNYQEKYIKYKLKYLNLLGGTDGNPAATASTDGNPVSTDSNPVSIDAKRIIATEFLFTTEKTHQENIKPELNYLYNLIIYGYLYYFFYDKDDIIDNNTNTILIKLLEKNIINDSQKEELCYKIDCKLKSEIQNFDKFFDDIYKHADLLNNFYGKIFKIENFEDFEEIVKQIINKLAPDENSSDIINKCLTNFTTSIDIYNHFVRNKNYLESKNVVVKENVDGLNVIKSLSKLSIDLPTSNVSFVMWGSPHLELVTGEYKYKDCRSQACIDKPLFLLRIIKQFPESICMITYCLSELELVSIKILYPNELYNEQTTYTDDEIININFFNVNCIINKFTLDDTEIQYIPSFSMGKQRCTSKDIKVLIYIPEGNLTLKKKIIEPEFNLILFMKYIYTTQSTKQVLFLGEEKFDLSCTFVHSLSENP